MKWLDEAKKLLTKYGWEDREVRPYPNCPMKASKILADCADFDSCTKGTKGYLLALATGMKDILERWVKYEQAEKVTVRVIKSGKILLMTKEEADGLKDFVEIVS